MGSFSSPTTIDPETSQIKSIFKKEQILACMPDEKKGFLLCYTNSVTMVGFPLLFLIVNCKNQTKLLQTKL